MLPGLVLILVIQPLQSAGQGTSPGAPLPEVIWSRTDFAPFFIIDGEYSNQGISDAIIRLFTQHIGGYRHSPTEMTLPRMLESARNGVPVCHVALLKTFEREAFIEYSDPVMITYANGIITTDEGLHRFGMNADRVGAVDLERLTASQLQISVHDGRSYSPLIDRIIARERDRPRSIFVLKMGRKQQDMIVRQLLASRLDGFIARPEEIYFDKTIKRIEQPLFFIGIKGQPAASLTRVGCTRGDWNDSLLQQINALIRQPEIRREIDRHYIKWLPPQLRDRYLSDQAGILGY